MDGFTFTPELGLLVGGLVGIIIGWVIGFFDSNRNSSKKIKQAEETARVAIQAAEEKAAQASASPVSVDDPGLLRIRNDHGAFALDLDGAPVNTASLSPDQRKRLIEMLNVMRPWLEGKPVQPIPAPPPAPPPSQPKTASVARPSVPAPVGPPTPTQPTPVAAAQKDDKPAAAPASMVGQINAILQTRIAISKFAEQGVTMIESPTGGVYVYVGLNRFEGIEAVPDDDIKAEIRAAIAEWEKKYTPGL